MARKNISTNMLQVVEEIKRNVLDDQAEYQTAKILETTNKEDRIDSFHGTYLSNFYICPVIYNDVIFPSPEHAY